MSEWLENLPEDLQDNADLQKLPDVSALAKSYLETRRTLNSSVRLPTEFADDEARNEAFGRVQKVFPNVLLMPDPDKPWSEQGDEFKEAFGIPKDEKEYALPEDVKLPREVHENLVSIAKGAGLNKAQWRSVVEVMAENRGQLEKAAKERAERDKGILKEKLAEAYDTAESSILLLAEQFQDEDYPLDLEDPEIAHAMSQPAVQLMLHNLMRDALGEGERISSLASEQKNPSTLDDLTAQMADLDASEKNKRWLSGEMEKSESKEWLKTRMALAEKIKQARAARGLD